MVLAALLSGYLIGPISGHLANIRCSEILCVEREDGRVSIVINPETASDGLDGLRVVREVASPRAPKPGEPWVRCVDVRCDDLSMARASCGDRSCIGVEEEEVDVVRLTIPRPYDYMVRNIAAAENCEPRTAATGPRGELVTASSFEQDREDGRPENLLDGNPATIWHSRWSKNPPPQPHWVAVDLGTACTLNLVEVGRRTDGSSNGDIVEYAVEMSMDGERWETATKGTWPSAYKGTVYAVFPPGGLMGRYFRLQVLRGVGGWGSASHLGWR